MNGEDMDRRLHWFNLARERGEEEDFKILLDDARRGIIQEERSKRWWGLARKLGQVDDFEALLADMQREERRRVEWERPRE